MSWQGSKEQGNGTWKKDNSMGAPFCHWFGQISGWGQKPQIGLNRMGLQVQGPLSNEREGTHCRLTGEEQF